MRKIKILYIIDTLGIAGAEKQLLGVLKRLDRKRYEPTLCCLKRWDLIDYDMNSLGIRIELLNVESIFRPSAIKELFRLVRIIRKAKIDIVHTYLFKANIFGSVAAKLAGVPIIIVGRRGMLKWKTRRQIWLDRLTDIPIADKIVSVAEAVRLYTAEREGIELDKAITIHNGVDLDIFNRNRINKDKETIKRELGLGKAEQVVGIIGSLRGLKGHRYFLQAASKILNYIPNTKFLIVGNGPLKMELEDFTNSLGIKENVMFMDIHPNIPEILSILDISVLSSLEEGLSNTLLESMAMQVPVVATNVGGNPEVVVDGETGYLIPTENPEALIDAICKILQDEKLSKNMGVAGRRRIKEHFSIDKMIGEIEQLYHSLINEKIANLMSLNERNQIEFMKKIKVMHLRSAFAAGGGPDKTILLSAEKIDSGKFDMVITYFKNSKDGKFMLTKKAKDRRLRFEEISMRGKLDPRGIIRLFRLIKGYKIDILHTHGYKSDIIGYFISKFVKVRLVTTVHGWINFNLKLRFYNWLTLLVLGHFKKVIVVSEANRKELANKGIPSHKLIRIYNGVDIDNFKPDDGVEDIRKELSLDSTVPAVGIIGRLSPEKDLATFFKAMVKVIEVIPEAKFLVVGDGQEKDKLAEYVKGLGISNCGFFLGLRKDILKIYKTLDLLVLSSETEGLPNTVLEAQAMEVPIVSTNVGGISEVIEDGKNGALVRQKSPSELAGRIIELLRNKDKAKKMAYEGRKVICERFSFDNRMRKIEELYLELMKEDGN